MAKKGRIYHIKAVGGDADEGAADEIDAFRPFYVTSYDMEDACLVAEDAPWELHHNDEDLLRSPHPMKQYWYALKAVW